MGPFNKQGIRPGAIQYDLIKLVIYVGTTGGKGLTKGLRVVCYHCLYQVRGWGVQNLNFLSLEVCVRDVKTNSLYRTAMVIKDSSNECILTVIKINDCEVH